MSAADKNTTPENGPIAVPAPTEVAQAPITADVAKDDALAPEAAPAPTLDDAVRSLIAVLGFKEEQISEIQVNAKGSVRVFETDRGFHSRKIERFKRKQVGA